MVLIKKVRIKFNVVKTISGIFILFLFFPSILSTVNYEPAVRYSWMMRHGFTEDYEILNWAHENIPSQDLIANDYSFSSRYLLSFSFKNVTAKYIFSSDFDLQRVNDIQMFWETPNDTSLLMNLIAVYNISYILITSEWGFQNISAIGGDNGYTAKPVPSSIYKELFDNNSLLELLVENDNAAIYKVKK